MMSQRAESITSLETKDLADLFRDFCATKYGLAGKFGGWLRGQGLNFYTPQGGDDPFEKLEAADSAPAFSAGASIPKFNKLGGGGTTVHIYVWDEGNRRRVRFYSPHSITGLATSKQFVEGLTKLVSSADPSSERI
jgi:hypothetical protein